MKEAKIGDLPSALGVVVLAALYGGVVLAIYPGWPEIWVFLNKNLLLENETPAWAQAIAGFLAVCVALFLPTIERKRSEREHRSNMVDACYVFADEACTALFNSRNKFARVNILRPESSLERLRNIEKIGLVLAGKDLPADMLVAVTKIMREISLAIQATEDFKHKQNSELNSGEPRARSRWKKVREQRKIIKKELSGVVKLNNTNVFDSLIND